MPSVMWAWRALALYGLFTAVLIALGMGIGVGGSVLMSTARGAGCDENANAARPIP